MILDLRRSLGLQIGMAFLVVALLPFAGIAMFSFRQVRDGTQRALEEDRALLLSQIGVEIERTVVSAQRHIHALSENPTLRSDRADTEEKLAEMKKIQDLYGLFEDITLIDPEGVVRISTTYQYRGEWKSKQWFKRALDGEITVSPAHVVPSPFKLVLVVTAPVTDASGAIRHVLGGQINMERIWEITDRVKLGQTGSVFVVDRSGNLIAGPEKSMLLEKIEPEFLRDAILSQGSGGVSVVSAGVEGFCQYLKLAGYQEYPGQDWRVGIIQSRAEMFATIERMRDELVAMACFGALLIVVLASLFSRTIIRPIHELNAGLLRLTEGDLAARVPIRGKDELGALAAAFNVMAGEIHRKTRELDEMNEKLSALNTKLSESNSNLQQFAYVASHDLQEPLRMVSSYVQLLARRYQGKLAGEADEFIGFAVDGARRMQQLINDLLEYSRVGTRTKPFEPTDANAVMARLNQTLKLRIEESKAKVTCDPLPTVLADPIQLEQLLQNLVGNALKFCKERPPEIRVSAKRTDEGWLFSVSDNGIGIDPQYYDRIFTIFQRLHTREEYPGTGIGLAICKKIVQRHGGRIWVESRPGEGSTFFFTVQEQGGNPE